MSKSRPIEYAGPPRAATVAQSNGERLGLPPVVEQEGNVARLTIPLAEIPPDVYVARHVELQLNNVQSNGLARMFWGLNGGNRRLANGRHVTTAADVVRYIFEQIEE